MTTLCRLGFKFLVIFTFAVLWPAADIAFATGILCLALAVGCLVAALARREPIRGGGLNHWYEAAALVAIAGSMLLAS
jgi:hypothetical protein